MCLINYVSSMCIRPYHCLNLPFGDGENNIQDDDDDWDGLLASPPRYRKETYTYNNSVHIYIYIYYRDNMNIIYTSFSEKSMDLNSHDQPLALGCLTWCLPLQLLLPLLRPRPGDA